jgi:hypothetical protein
VSAQKSALLEASRRGLITEETANTRVNELDRNLVAVTFHDKESS